MVRGKTHFKQNSHEEIKTQVNRVMRMAKKTKNKKKAKVRISLSLVRVVGRVITIVCLDIL